jgi:hypothetical protein
MAELTPRIRKEREVGPRGFSRWVNPAMKGYLLQCCDCGLVHELEFKAFRREKVYANGRYTLSTLPRTKYGVMFRARRKRVR